MNETYVNTFACLFQTALLGKRHVQHALFFTQDPAAWRLEMDHYIWEVGGLDQPGNRFVSFVRARAAVCKVRMDLENDSPAFPFSLFTLMFLPFFLKRSSVPFPLGLVRSREPKLDQVNPSEIK